VCKQDGVFVHVCECVCVYKKKDVCLCVFVCMHVHVYESTCVCVDAYACRLVLEGKGIASVAAGRYHSFALSDRGVLYSWGCGENGQLGLGTDDNVVLPSVVTTILGTVVGRVSCGEHHTAVITSAPWSKISQVGGV
jgi:hypothetical protein